MKLDAIQFNTSTTDTPSWTKLVDLIYPKNSIYLTRGTNAPGNGDNAPFISSTMSDRWWATFSTPTSKIQGMGRITSTTQEGYSNLPAYQNCYGWYRNS